MANPTQQIHQPQNSPFNRYLTFLPVLRALPSRWLVIALFPDVLAGIQIPASHIPRRYSRYPPRRRAVAAGSALHLRYGQILSLGPPGACGHYLSSDCPSGRCRPIAMLLSWARLGRCADERLGLFVDQVLAFPLQVASLRSMARSSPVREWIDAQRG